MQHTRIRKKIIMLKEEEKQATCIRTRTRINVGRRLFIGICAEKTDGR